MFVTLALHALAVTQVATVYHPFIVLSVVLSAPESSGVGVMHQYVYFHRLQIFCRRLKNSFAVGLFF